MLLNQILFNNFNKKKIVFKIMINNKSTNQIFNITNK